MNATHATALEALNLATLIDFRGVGCMFPLLISRLGFEEDVCDAALTGWINTHSRPILEETIIRLKVARDLIRNEDDRDLLFAGVLACQRIEVECDCHRDFADFEAAHGLECDSDIPF